MAQLKSWISASRLRTLPLSISGAIVGSSYAYFKDFFDAPIFILIILTTLSFQILSNLANDYGDGVKGTDNESRIGPKRALQSGAISAKQMRLAVVFNAFISAILAITLILLVFGLDQLYNALIFIVLGGYLFMLQLATRLGSLHMAIKHLSILWCFYFLVYSVFLVLFSCLLSTLIFVCCYQLHQLDS